MDYYVPLHHNAQNLYTTIAYEDLLRSSSAVKNLKQLLELDVKNFEVSRLIALYSPIAKDIVSKALDNIYKWKGRPSRPQIGSILRVTHTYNLTFYAVNIELDYNKQYNIVLKD